MFEPNFFSIQRLVFQKYFEALKVCDLFLKSMEQTTVLSGNCGYFLESQIIGFWYKFSLGSRRNKAFQASKPLVDSSSFYGIQMHTAVNSNIFEALLNLFYRIQSVLVHFYAQNSSFLLKLAVSLVISEKQTCLLVFFPLRTIEMNDILKQ